MFQNEGKKQFEDWDSRLQERGGGGGSRVLTCASYLSDQSKLNYVLKL